MTLVELYSNCAYLLDHVVIVLQPASIDPAVHSILQLMERLHLQQQVEAKFIDGQPQENSRTFHVCANFIILLYYSIPPRKPAFLNYALTLKIIV